MNKKILIILLFILSVFSFIGISYAGRGCCSYHGGQSYCGENGKWICKDGTESPNCSCEGGQTYTPKEYVYEDTSDNNSNKNNDYKYEEYEKKEKEAHPVLYLLLGIGYFILSTFIVDKIQNWGNKK